MAEEVCDDQASRIERSLKGMLKTLSYLERQLAKVLQAMKAKGCPIAETENIVE